MKKNKKQKLLAKKSKRERFLIFFLFYLSLFFLFFLYKTFIYTVPPVDMDKIEKAYEKEIHISQLGNFVKNHKIVSFVQPDISFASYFEIVILTEDGKSLETYKIFKNVNEEWKDFNLDKKELGIENIYEGVGLSVPERNKFLELLGSIAPLLFFLLFFLWIIKAQMGGGKSQIETFDGKSENKIVFNDIGGIESQKTEILSFIETIKNIKKFNKRGVRTPRGVLLSGPPGVGKTMIAKAIAGTVGIDLFIAKGTDFKSKFYGEGAKNVDKAFKKITTFLSKHKKDVAILFIDEIENLLKERGTSHSADDDIVNTFLDKIDGIEGSTNIILIGATNHLDIIDKAARSRFDIEIDFAMPNYNERLDIIEKLISNREKKDLEMKISKDLDLGILASYTIGQSGRFIESIINQTHIESIKKDKIIDTKLLLSVWEDKVLGKEKLDIHFNEKDADTVCIHELGHGIISHIENERVIKLTNIPRGRALGICFSIPKEEKILKTEKDILSEIRILLAGRIAEEVFLKRITTGASNDLERIEVLLFDYLTRYNFTYNNKGLGYVIDKTMLRNDIYTAQIKEDIKVIVKDIYKKESDKVRKFFKQKKIKDLFWKMHLSLIKKRNLFEKDFNDFLKNEKI